METIRVATSGGSANELKLVDVSGERMLKGCADTGVFRIVAIDEERREAQRKDEGQRPRAPDRDLEFATIRCDGPLSLAGTERGNDPYNRSGRWMKSS